MTHVSLLTPTGTGAIATIAVLGPDAWSIAQRVFQRSNGRPLPNRPQAGQFWYGRVGGEKGDEVILAVRATEPKVWTEYHCHGGKLVTEWLMKLFANEDCEAISWADFIARSENCSSKDTIALRFLPEARTLRTASILLDQYHGAYLRAVREAMTALMNNDVEKAQTMIQALLRHADVGLHLTRPWRIAVAGLPNAGKSSLVNALAGYQRSVVAPIPGTTRDVVTTTLAFHGWPVELSDTAGLRQSADDLEREGVARARRALEDTDLCLWVIDVTGELPPGKDAFAAQNKLPVSRILPVLNKTDLPSAWDVSRFLDAVAVSALTGAGIDALITRMIQRLIPDDPLPGAAVPYSPERIQCLRISQGHIANGEIESALTSLLHSTQSIG